MGPSRARALVAMAAVVAAVVLFVVLSGDDDSTTTSEAPTIEIENGQPVGGVQDLTFTAGDDIRFNVKSDTAAGVHFHGYDVEQEVEAGGQVSFDVPADIEGVFELELEETATPLAEISVEP